MAVARVNAISAIYKPVYMAGGLSGGHDSITACYIASLSNGFRGQFHCDTGVGLKATELFVTGLCAKMRWPLEVYRALDNTKSDGTPDPMDYFAMLEKAGFPGPGTHWMMYVKLKERQILRWVRDHKTKRKDRIMIVTGARRQESKIRSQDGRVEEHRREGALVWCNPIFDFSKLDCTRIMEYANLPRSPVVDLIHKSGECLCGAFGKDGELSETAFWFPNDPCVLRLVEADKRLKVTMGWGWGGRPPRKGSCVKTSGPMCASCDANNSTK